MIEMVNKAIDRKLKNQNFTNIVSGIVESLEPLKIKLNDRLVIGLEFIEPKSLGLDENSPHQALPFVIGDKINMISYNKGQKFYVLGTAGSGGGTSDYSKLTNKPILNSSNSDSLPTSNNEEINGILNLHKVAKTGSYEDLKNKPTTKVIDNLTSTSTTDSLSAAQGKYLNDNKLNTSGGTIEGTLKINNGLQTLVYIDVQGDADTFYPLLISQTNRIQYKYGMVSISRNYAELAPSTWYTATHKGGLTFSLYWNGDSAWGGNGNVKGYSILQNIQIYSEMIKRVALSTKGLVIWLRGGGARYWFDAKDFNSYSLNLEGFTDDRGTFYGPLDLDYESNLANVRSILTSDNGKQSVLNSIEIATNNNQDLNNYTQVGTYSKIYESTSTVLNTPTNQGFILNVYKDASNDYCVQQITTREASTRQFIRSKISSGWTTWSENINSSVQTKLTSYVAEGSGSGNYLIGSDASGYTQMFKSGSAGEHIFGGTRANTNKNTIVTDFIRIGINKLKYTSAAGEADIFHSLNCVALKSNNGYQKLANGIIIQWGESSTFSQYDSSYINFPISFPNNCLNVIAVAFYNNSNYTYVQTVYGFNPVNFAAKMSSTGNSLRYIAIGY